VNKMNNSKSFSNPEKKGWYECVGVMHIHSSDSDGSKSIPEITEIGGGLGLDFLFFTDHMILKSYHRNLEGWYPKGTSKKKTLVVIGYEINDGNNKNHYLAYNLNDLVPGELSAYEYVKEVKKKGGFGIIAHPDEIRDRFTQFPSYPWTCWETEDFDGIELWNQMSEWMEKLNKKNELKMVLSPRRSLVSPTPRILSRWDQLNKKRKVVGVGGVDAHAHPIEIGPLRITIFPYKVQFKSLRTHILLDKPLSSDFSKAKLQLFSALKNCNVFTSNYRWGDAKGFKFYAELKGRYFKVGDDINFEDGIILGVNTPDAAQIKLVSDGKVIAENNGSNLSYKIDSKGNFRVEVFRNGKGWIFSNHIRVV